MVAAVACVPDRRIVAVHRTFLSADGRGKANVLNPKCSLGPVGGGAVRLAPAGPKLVVAEGIENALTVMQAVGLPTWAALSAGGIARLILPPLPLAAEVVIAADRDSNGVGQSKADVAAERWLAEGRRVRIALPPEAGVDFNDLLGAEGAAA
jgi:putative DNA primase/helicase